jgi:rhodanese-related sulfurtransferase
MSSETSSTIGRERATNDALGFQDVQEFVLESASISAPRPPTTERVVALNRGPWVALPDPPPALSDPGGATVLDVRTAALFGEGHVHGAFNVPVSGTSFGTRAAFVLDGDETVVLHASSVEEAVEAARRLWAVGLFAIAGYVTAAPTTEPLRPLGVAELKRLLGSDGTVDDGVQLVDVRETSERDAGYIAGSRHIPYRLLRKTGAAALERDRPVVTVCESGPRAAIAASILVREGFDARPVVDGGIADLDERETVSFRRCGS